MDHDLRNQRQGGDSRYNEIHLELGDQPGEMGHVNGDPRQINVGDRIIGERGLYIVLPGRRQTIFEGGFLGSPLYLKVRAITVILAWDTVNSDDVFFYRFTNLDEWHKNTRHSYDPQKVLKAAQEKHPELGYREDDPVSAFLFASSFVCLTVFSTPKTTGCTAKKENLQIVSTCPVNSNAQVPDMDRVQAWVLERCANCGEAFVPASEPFVPEITEPTDEKV